MKLFWPPLISRWTALMLWLLAAYFAYTGVMIAVVMVRSIFFSGPWLGLEPELLIPLPILAIAAGLAWTGRAVWRRATGLFS